MAHRAGKCILPIARQLLWFVSIAHTLIPAFAQTTGPQSPPTIATTSREVLLDVVARGNNGRFIRDLKAGEVEVYENGVKQKINDFRLIQGKDAQEAEKRIEREASTRPGATVASIHDLNVISIVFAGMGANQRMNTLKAVEQFLRKDFGPNMLVGLFSLESRLFAWNSYTNDAKALSAKVKKAMTMSPSELRQESAAALSAAELIVAGGRGGITTSAGIDQTSAAAATAGADFSTAEGAQVMYSILNSERIQEGHVQGMAAMDALQNLVAAQARLPGRKTVIYMSTGLAVPPDFRERFRFILSAANRAGVTFYVVNTGGLQTTSPFAASRSSLNNVAELSRSQSTIDSSGTPAAVAAAARQDDMLMHALRGNANMNMRELAESTGGFVIENTNDISIPMNRILEESSTHYALAYTPQIDTYDGSFRSIEVRVSRPKVTVHTRSGYFALPEIQGKQLTPYEAAALKVLSTNPRSTELHVQAAALRFRPGATIQYAYVAELSGADIAGREDTTTHTKALDTVILALIKNASGEVVEKISTDMSLSLPSDRWQQLQSGKLMFEHPFFLPPGRYSVETVVLDRVSGRSGVHRSALIIPARAQGPELSSVVLVRRIERKDSTDERADPLLVGSAWVNPTLSHFELANKSPHFYFVAYPTAAESMPDVTVQISRDGRVVSRAKAQPIAKVEGGQAFLYSPDHLDLTAGTYDVTVTMIDGTVAARQGFSLTAE